MVPGSTQKLFEDAEASLYTVTILKVRTHLLTRQSVSQSMDGRDWGESTHPPRQSVNQSSQSMHRRDSG